MTSETSYNKAGVDAALAKKVDLPGGGTDGQVLAKSGTSTVWATIGTSSGTGSGGVTESVNSSGYAVLSGASGGGSTTTYLRGVAYGSGTFGTEPAYLGTNAIARYGTGWEYGTQATYTYLASRGHKIIRLGFLWEHLQLNLGDPLDPTLLGYLKNALGYIANAGMKAILDMHNYAAYATAASNYTPQKIGQGVVTDANFIDVWTKISTELKGNPGVYGYGLMNEPGDAYPTTWTTAQRTTAWHNLTQNVLTAIRNNGDTTRVIIDDMQMSGATQQWDLLNGAPWITDPAGNFAYEHHHYSDANHSGTYTNSYATELSLAQQAGYASIQARDSAYFAPFLNWCKNYGVPGFVGEYGVPTIGTDATNWATVSDAFLTLLDTYKMDFTWWAVGELWAAYTLAPYTTSTGSNGVINTANPGSSSLEKHPSLTSTSNGSWMITTISPSQVDAKIAAAGGGSGSGGDVSLVKYLPSGYVTDGSVAYDSAFQSLLGANTAVYVPEGTWLLNNALNIPNTVVSITLHPNAIIKTNATNTKPITRTGTSTSTATSISSGASAGSKTITLPSLGTIGGGAWLFITSDDVISGGTTYPAVIRRVTSVSSTTLTLDQALPVTFTTNPRVYSLQLAPKLTLRGGQWRHANPTSVTGSRALFYFELSMGPELFDVDITNNGGPAISLAHCVSGRARNFGMADLLDNPTGNFYGQGLSIEGASRDFVYESGTVVRCRMAVNTYYSQIAVGDIAAGATGRGLTENIRVLSGVKVRDTNYGINIDTTAIGFRVEDAVLQNTNIGVQNLGQNSVISIANDGAYKYGVYIASTATNTTVAVRMTNPSTAPGAGAAAIFNVGTNTRIRPSYFTSPPAGWSAINSTPAYTFEGQGRLDGARVGGGVVTYASFDSSGDVSTLGGSGGTGTVSDATSTTKGVIQLAGDLGGTAAAPTLKSVGTAGTYGDATHVPQFTTDSAGRVTGVTSVAISASGGATINDSAVNTTTTWSSTKLNNSFIRFATDQATADTFPAGSVTLLLKPISDGSVAQSMGLGAGANNGTTYTVSSLTFTKTATKGNLLVSQISIDHIKTHATTVPTGWTEIGTEAATSGDATTGVITRTAYKISDGTETAVAWGGTIATDYAVSAIEYNYQNAQLGQISTTTSSGTVTTLTADPGAATTSGLAVGLLSVDTFTTNWATLTWGNSYTDQYDFEPTTSADVGSISGMPGQSYASKIVAASGATAATFTAAAADEHILRVAIFYGDSNTDYVGPIPLVGSTAFTWGAPQGKAVDSYQYQLAASSAAVPATTPSWTTTASVTFSGVQYIRVRATYTDGTTSPWSPVVHS